MDLQLLSCFNIQKNPYVEHLLLSCYSKCYEEVFSNTIVKVSIV